MTPTENQQARPLGRAEINSIVIGLMTAMFPGALDATIVAPAMPTIGRELGNVEHLPWIVTSYLLMTTASTPLYGKLSDIHGRRIMLMISIAIFAVGSLMCALSPNMIMLAIARAVQGIGGGGLVSLSITIIGDVVPMRERPRYQIYTSVMWTASSLAGPILGGYFAEKIHWSLIFWINLPLCLAAYLMTDSKLRRLPRHERPHKLDFAGAVLLVIGSILWQLTLMWGGSRYAWSSPEILSLLAVAAAVTGLLVWRLLTAAEPLIPLGLLSHRTMLTASLGVGLAMAVFIGLTIYVPVYFENGLGFSASESGLALLPLMLCTTFGAVSAGSLMMRIRHYRFIPITGLSLASLCLLPMFIWPDTLSLTVIEILFALASVGVGTVFPVSMISVQNSVPPHQLGTATSMVSFMRNFGSAFGVAIFGAIVIGGGAAANGSGKDILTGDAFMAVFRWVFLTASVGLAMAVAILSRMREAPIGNRRRDGGDTAAH